MQNQVITNIDQVTTEWLTAVLTQDGALRNGHVAAFDLEADSGNWSTNAQLTLTYSIDAQGTLPQHLFLKMANTNLGDGEFFDDSEVTYYTRDYVDVPDTPLLHCYAAVYSAEQQRYHLLLDDVSATHIDSSQKEPTLEFGLALAEGLASLHARWWGVDRLAEANAPIHNAAFIQQFVAIAEPGVAHILDAFTPALKPHWPTLLHELYAQHPQAIIKRSQDANGFTLIHGDAGEHNILVPRIGERPIYIIDRQPFNWSLTTWLGVYDLVYAMVIDWPLATRRLYEEAVLEQYHAQLLQNGVTGYTWQQLVADYRLMVPMCVYIATEYCRGGINQRWIRYWLPMLKKILTACDDLDCRALW